MADNNTVPESCYAWLEERVPVNATIHDVNGQFQARNMGGIVFVSLLCMVGVVGNFHVLLLFSRHYKRSSYRTYILFLGALDMTNSAISMPLTIVYLSFPLEYFNDFFCKIYRLLLYYVSIASTLILVIIAVDRYRKIRTPLKRQWTEKQTFRLCVAGLAFGLLFAWPAPVLYGGSSVPLPINNLTGNRCYIEDQFKHTSLTPIFNIILASLFVLILSILTTLYHYIWKAVKRFVHFPNEIGSVLSLTHSASVDLDKKCSTKECQKEKNPRYVQLRRTTITLLLVTIGYLVSAFPHHCLALVIFVFPDIECEMSFGAGVIYYTFVWIFLVNNVINPIIYSLSDVKFLRRLKSMYNCKVIKRIGK